MSTKAQIKANRQNAKKSTGPKSPEGKETSSQNATKHGLLSHRDVISSESQADFDLHRDLFLQELNPETPIQSFIADRIVSLSWRLKRAEIIQNQAIDAIDEKNNTPIEKLTRSLMKKVRFNSAVDPESQKPPLDIPLGHLAVKDFAHYRVLDRLLMYERRLENSLHKTMQEYQRLKLMKKLDTEQQTQVDHSTNQKVSTQSILSKNISEASVPSVAKNKKMSNEPNLKPPINVTPFPTSNYGKFNRLQKPQTQPILGFSSNVEEGPIPFLPAKLTDEDCLPYVALAKEGARWKASKNKEKKLI